MFRVMFDRVRCWAGQPGRHRRSADLPPELPPASPESDHWGELATAAEKRRAREMDWRMILASLEDGSVFA